MTKLAESSGTVIYEAGKKLYISKRPAQWIPVFLFVTGLLGFILLLNGVLQLTVLKDQHPDASKPGIALIVTAVFAFVVFWKVKLIQSKTKAIPPHELQNICILDFEHNHLLDSQQNILGSLDSVWLTRKMQLASSSPGLMLSWDRGSISIVSGNPFSGGIANIEKLLLSKGIRKK